MGTEFTYDNKNLYTPVIFREDFTNANLSLNQAWSLFFTAGEEENSLGRNKKTGWFFNNTLIAFVITAIMGATVFNNFATIQF